MVEARREREERVLTAVRVVGRSGLYCGHGPRGEGDPDCEGRGGQHQKQPHAVHLHLVSHPQSLLLRLQHQTETLTRDDTRYGLALATSVMFYILVKRPPPDITKRVRQSGEWA